MQSSQTNLAVASASPAARVLLALEKYFPVVEAPEHAGEHAPYEFAKAAASFAPHVRRISGLAGKRVLDFGCGWGGETVWLARQAQEAVGCDIAQASLEDAASFARESQCDNVRFVHVRDSCLPLESETFDAVFSTNVFEHVMDPEAALREIARVLKPGGSFVSTFGPLFYSPLGYHLPWATQVPYAHLFFGLGTVMEVRNRRRAPISPLSWEETGLNRITFGRFRRAARTAGLEAVILRRIPVRRTSLLCRLPLVGDLFTFGIDCHLVKR